MTNTAPLRGGGPILIDSDTAVDDAMGLFYALRAPDANRLVGITTVSGNVPVDFATDNALRVVELEHSTLPVSRGSAVTVMGTVPSGASYVHGARGTGREILPPPGRRAADGNATETILSAVRQADDHLTIAAVGPLTNIANALSADRAQMLRFRPTIVWMGGAVTASGNVSAGAEFNAATDPQAAQIVLNSGLDITMIPLDVTERNPRWPGAVTLDDTDLAALNNSSDQGAMLLAQMTTGYIDFYATVFGTRACPAHSAIAIAVAFDRALITSSYTTTVTVVTESGPATGMTIADRRHQRRDPYYDATQDHSNLPGGAVDVVTEIDGDRFKAALMDRMLRRRRLSEK